MSAREFRRVGVTGGIGAGKSTVTGRLRELGAVVIDADMASRAVVEPGSEGLARIVKRFGPEMLDADGSLARARLAQQVFADARSREALNGILHPLVGEWMRREEHMQLMQTGSPLVFWDVPLLMETKMDAQMDHVWLVSAPQRIRIARIMARDGCTASQARARMKSQMCERDKRKRADVILDNSGVTAALYAQVDAQYARELELARRGGSFETSKA